MRKRTEAPDLETSTRGAKAREARTIRIIIMLVVAGWGLALALMGVAAMFWDRQ
jgi:hypothetical protein